MSDPVPYLGSKISLISKSEIRYEGILYTIDAQESIIALAKVQSFGTEDRQVEIPVPAKSEIYEYIIFRGTDIKKIEVCDTPKQQPLSGGLHNDPAIVGLQQHAVPPTVQSSYPSASFNRQPLGPIGSIGGPYYGGYGQHLGQQAAGGFSMGTTQPSELASGMGGSGSGVGSSVAGSVSIEQVSPGGISKSIPTPIGAPPRSGGGGSHSHQDVLAGSRSSTPSVVSRKSPVSDAGVQVSVPQHQEKKKPLPNQNQRMPPYSDRDRNMKENHQQANQNRRSSGGQTNYRSSNQGYQGGYYQNQYHQYQGGRGNMGRGRPSRRATQSRGRGGSGYGQGTRQILDKEFDFEQGNVEFEEIRTQLAKTKISDTDKKEEKKEDSGHETATTGDESEDSATSSAFYDKTKSFFDSISCEALERSKGKSQRPDWRQERKINVQTFGVATARRGYYPRGRGGYYNRGGYYRNYNQDYYRGNSGSGYRGHRGGGSGGGNRTGNMNKNSSSSMNGPSGGTGSYASAVRNATATAAK